jgi:4'-phosphopantetheinyl transferase
VRLHPLPWIPAGGGEAGLAERLPHRPAAPPLVLRIDRRAAAVRDRLADLAALLSADETDRLERFRRSEDRERFLLGRASLRLCLAALLAEDPGQLRLAATAAGKPFLADASGRPRPQAPQFNLSHSGDLILLALHGGGPVGVDVERLRPSLDWRPIARRCLEPGVLARMESLAAAHQPLAFLEAWCALEASLKAGGGGLAGPRPEPDTCRLWTLELPPDYRGAVALRARAVAAQGAPRSPRG